MKVLMWEHHSWDSPIRVGGRAIAEKFLEEGWEVAWINGPLAPWNLVGGNAETRRRRRSWAAGGETMQWGNGRLFAWTPLSWVPYRPYPILDRAWLHRHALDGTIPALRRHLARHGFERVDLLWMATGSPFLPLLDKLPHATSLYRLSDDTSAFPDTPATYGALEEEALRRVDCVVATAASLAERAAKFCRRVLLLPNAADLSRFRAVRSLRTAPAAGKGGGRIVYVGALDSWFDARRVALIARRFPHAEILLAGPLRMDTSWAKPLQNVRLLGPVPPEEVPALLMECDVGIIPFIDSSLTRAIHPVKLYEYLAAGLGVVAEDLDEIRRIGSPALLASSDAQWIECLTRALESPEQARSRSFAEQHDWAARFAALREFLGFDHPAAGVARRLAR